jgi:hypothetical protein
MRGKKGARGGLWTSGKGRVCEGGGINTTHVSPNRKSAKLVKNMRKVRMILTHCYILNFEKQFGEFTGKMLSSNP